jgi:hypothetical protein
VWKQLVLGKPDGIVRATKERHIVKSVDVVIPLSSDLDNDRKAALAHVLAAVKTFSPASIVVSECSPDGKVSMEFPGVKSIAVKSNWNKPVAVNEAVLKHTSADWIFVLDADVCMDFSKARLLFENRPAQEQVFRPCNKIMRLSAADTHAVYAGKPFPAITDENKNVETLLCGGAFLIKRQLFLDVRGFDERFDIYMEDTDLKRRLLGKGVTVGIAKLSGYHLYHTPPSRNGIYYSAENHRRRQLSPEQVLRDTVSRIGQSEAARPKLPKERNSQMDIVVPHCAGNATEIRVLRCVVDSLRELGAANVYVCGTSAPDGMTPDVQVIRSDSVAEAVKQALTKSKASWIYLHSPTTRVNSTACRQFFARLSPSYDLLHMADRRLTLKPQAANRVLAGQTVVKKLDGALSESTPAFSFAVRRRLIEEVSPHPGMNVETVLDVYAKAAAAHRGCRIAVNKAIAIGLESITGARPTVKQPAPQTKSGTELKKKTVALKTGQEQKTTISAPGVLRPTIAAAVQCHTDYLPVLEKCIDAVEAQTYQAAEKYLVLDGCDLPDSLRAKTSSWTVIKRSDGTPNPGRNAALHATNCDWIWYIDADDVPDKNYLEGAARLTGNSHVGIIVADLRYSGGARKETPDKTEYWGLRLSNYVSTESVWRTCALREAGGWQNTKKWDDWTCALNVTGLGWHTAKNSVPILVTEHGHNNHRNVPGPKEINHKWHRSYCVVSLLAGRTDIWADWSNAVLNMTYPAKTSFMFIDNSKNPEFAAKVQALVAALMAKGYNAQYLQDNTVSEERDRYSRHRVVAHLYNRACSRLKEDVTVFWEDDNIPVSNQALYDLVTHWDITRVGGICAVYESRNGIGKACGTYNHDFWGVMPPLAEMKGKISEGLGFIPGGFACYHTALVLQALPFHVDYPEGKADGWDGKLSRSVRSSGRLLVLDGTVDCEHRFRGTK